MVGGVALFYRRYRKKEKDGDSESCWWLFAVGVWYIAMSAYFLRSAPDARFFLPGLPFVLLPFIDGVVRLPRLKMIISIIAAMAILQGGQVLKKTYDLRNVSTGLRDAISYLQENPLPPSLKIFIKPAYRNAEAVDKIYDRVAGLRGIDQVVYRKDLLVLIDQRTKTINDVTLGLGILISISAILLVSNTIRLAIDAKRKLIRTMELVGATYTFIRLPFLVEGVLQGICGGLLASALLYGVLEYTARLLASDFSTYIHMPAAFYFLVVVAGTVLGLIGAIISIVRFMRVRER